MSQQDVLNALGLSQPELDQIGKGLDALNQGLNAKQKRILLQSVHGKNAAQIAQAVQAVGGTATVADVKAVFVNVPDSGGVYFLSCC